MRTQIVPDAATCPACLAEMNNPRERRYRYPFINCTHCGPRFTIIRAMPYDRPFTSMAPFPSVRAARRSTATLPIAVFTLSRWPAPTAARAGVARGRRVAGRRSGIAGGDSSAAAGEIVAIKGVGGFHLVCDAGNPRAVAALRARKHRPAKPLAVMLPAADSLPEAAQALLTSPAAPIVLIEKAQVAGLCDEIAPALRKWGDAAV
jgi:hydrogenase maturation protein HypF